jgi:hypothetical protein
MAKLHDQWTVLPHGPLRELDEGLLTVVGQIPMPLGYFPRRMTVVRLADGGTALFSPIPLAEADMTRIEALGDPSYLIVPNGGHRLDARPYKKRYPRAKIVAASGAKTLVSEAVKVDTVKPALGDGVRLVTVPGTGQSELALEVRRPGGTTLVVNDIIAHVTRPQGVGAWVMARLFGFGPGRPQLPKPVRIKLVDDPAALARQCRAWAALPGLRRIVPSHGEVIDQHPAIELERLAAAIDPR